MKNHLADATSKPLFIYLFIEQFQCFEDLLWLMPDLLDLTFMKLLGSWPVTNENFE